MNSLFGDATSVMPTPETLAEVESLMSATRSPVPSLDIRGRGITADHAIPGLDIDPPSVKDSPGGGAKPEGVGGWITNMVARARGNGDAESSREGYKKVDQDEEGREG